MDTAKTFQAKRVRSLGDQAVTFRSPDHRHGDLVTLDVYDRGHYDHTATYRVSHRPSTADERLVWPPEVLAFPARDPEPATVWPTRRRTAKTG